MTLEEMLAFFSVVFSALGILQLYLVYRLDRARLKLESYTGISEKSELEIKPEVQGGQNEVIRIANKGILPIDEIKANIDIAVERRNKPILPLHLEWERKTLLSSKEMAVIPLNEKLSDFYMKHKLITLSKGVEFPSEDPETGEEVTDTFYVGELAAPFSLTLEIEIQSKIQGPSKTTRKKFRLTYHFKPPPYSDWEEDYEILVNEHMGEWKN